MDDKRKKENYIADRATLISFFKKGNLPKQEHFEQLINSNFNKADDRLDISEDEGLMIYPANEGELISLFEEKDDENAKFVLSISKKGVFIKELENTDNQQDSSKNTHTKPAFFIAEGSGNIGIGTETPVQKLDVDGLVAFHGRMGSFKEGQLPADGQWHNVFDKNLNGVWGFEVMSYSRAKEGQGKYALLHATAVNTFGQGEISKTQAVYGMSSYKIDIRWVARPSRIFAGKEKKDKSKPKTGLFHSFFTWFRELFEAKGLDYNLQLKTKSHYGNNEESVDSSSINIYYKLSVLWNPDVVPWSGLSNANQISEGE